MKWIFHKREARVIYSLTTNRQPVMYWTKNLLKARIYFDFNTQETTKRKCILQMFPVFRHYMKRNPAKNFDCSGGILHVFRKYLVRENNVTPSSVIEL